MYFFLQQSPDATAVHRIAVAQVLLLPVDDLVPLLLQRRDDGGVGHGGGVAEILVVGRNLAEDAPHDLSRASLWQGWGVL